LAQGSALPFLRGAPAPQVGGLSLIIAG
jgi:hypothetical protein